MSAFKDAAQADIHQTFLNTDEFSDMHKVNGKLMAAQVDDNEEIEREKRYKDHMDGVFVNQKLIYVAASDFGPLPKEGSKLLFDGRPYTVNQAIDEGGVYSITLEANRA